VGGRIRRCGVISSCQSVPLPTLLSASGHESDSCNYVCINTDLTGFFIAVGGGGSWHRNLWRAIRAYRRYVSCITGQSSTQSRRYLAGKADGRTPNSQHAAVQPSPLYVISRRQPSSRHSGIVIVIARRSGGTFARSLWHR